MLCLPLLDCNSGSLLSHLAPSIVEEIIITQGVNFDEVNVVFSSGEISSRIASSRPECSKAEKSLDYAQALLEFPFQADLDTIASSRIAGQERYITGVVYQRMDMESQSFSGLRGDFCFSLPFFYLKRDLKTR